MIYLLTGSNGSGKTLFALQFICETLNKDNTRPVFYFSPPSKPIGIAEAGVLDWQAITVDQAKDWWNFPQGSIFLIDECRIIFPWRDYKKGTPDYVELLADHRDKGFDFVLTAQKPSAQFDPALQGFIEEHRHLEGLRGFDRSRHYVYQSFCSSPLNPPKLQVCEPVTIPFNKKYYSYYRSAALHTKARRIPWRKLSLVLLALLVFVGASVFAVRTIYGFASGSDEPASGNSFLPSPVSSGSDNVLGLRPVPSQDQALTVEQYLAMRIPRVSDIPESAPVYDSLTEPKTFPRVSACIHRPFKADCKCYSQQGTPLDISFKFCLSYVRKGVFNPYVEERKPAQAPARADQRSSAAPAALTSL